MGGGGDARVAITRCVALLWICMIPVIILEIYRSSNYRNNHKKEFKKTNYIT